MDALASLLLTALFRAIDHQAGQAWALNELGVVQQLTGDYAAAGASHQQALALYCDFGDQLGQAEAPNNLGELSTRTATGHQARNHHQRTDRPVLSVRLRLGAGRAWPGS